MSQTRRPAPAGSFKAEAYGWLDALATVVAGMLAMLVVASLGLWAAGAPDLPGDAFPRLVAAMVVIAVGGSVDMSGQAGIIAETQAGLEGVPLSVSLAGALVVAAVFLLLLRLRAVASGGETLARVARTAALWLLGLLLLALAARHTFLIPLNNKLAEEIARALGATPTVGFRASVPATLGFGLLWLLVVLALAVVTSRKAVLPSGLRGVQQAVRPHALAMVLLLLAYVAAGLVVGVVVAFTRGHPADTFAVLLLALPNLAWMALGLGLGASWKGHVDAPIGLPMPHVLDRVLRTPEGGDRTVTVGTLAEYDGRMWWLVAIAAVAVLAAGFVAARYSPAGTRAWQTAVGLGIALMITLVVIGQLTRIFAHYGLSLLGVGDIGALGGQVALRPNLLGMAGLGLLWGLVAGFLGSLPATGVRRGGAGREAPPPRATRP